MIVHTVDCPTSKVISLLLTVVLLVQLQSLALYPVTLPLSLKVYVPALNSFPLVTPPSPEIEVGPSAFKFQSVATAVPPYLLLTVLINCNDGAMSLLTIVQVTSWPSGSVKTPLVPREHSRLSIVYPVSAIISDKVYS